jgi:catechol 2,3-dioxygenase-like lactoylglutathione lyase family enzyme
LLSVATPAGVAAAAASGGVEGECPNDREAVAGLESPNVITGVHAIVFTLDAAADRAFFRDVLGFPSVDAGGGWLIFALPPAELAAHPVDEAAHHELYLICDDVRATVEDLKAKQVEFTRDITDEGFGLLTALRLPGGSELGLYEPRHASPLSPPS